MKLTSSISRERGSVLMVALLTIFVLTLICATSLNIASQSGNNAAQTVAWQQSLNAAESGVNQAVASLNGNSWTNWGVYSAPVPSTAPSSSPTPPAAAAPPDTSHYNLLRTASIPLQTTGYGIPNLITSAGEGSQLSNWVTVDTAGMGTDANGNQWYRIRSTGTATAPGLRRVSGNSADTQLRKMNYFFDRKSGATIPNNPPYASRTIEVIAQPLASSQWSRGITLQNWISMSGSGVVDSFDSSSAFKSTNGLYDINKRQNHGDVGTKNSTTSDLRSTYVYGNVAYSGPAIKNTSHVQGTISTPFNPTIPTTADPSWAAGSYTSYVGGGSPPANSITASGNKNNPTLIKINGDFTVPGGKTFTVSSGGGTARYVTIWVTGKFTTSGSGYITQDPNVNVTWIVDNDITVSGDSYNNQSGLAGNASFVGVGTNHKVTDSGSATFIGTINTPGYDVTVSGSGAFSGAIIANTLTISGGASLHYDEALNRGTSSSSVGNYAYASWFEDTR